MKFIDSNMNFIPSTIQAGKRMRAFANKIWFCPIEDTFHTFLEDNAIGLIGNEWWFHQEKMSQENQNSLFHFADSFLKAAIEASRKNERREKLISLPCSGPYLAWMSLCYDLLCLEHKFALPEVLIEKLKTNLEFQSARYEITIAAILLRAGCNIKWIDTKLRPEGEKSCEFIATHRRSKTTFGVEVKSKKRPGILNEAGIFASNPIGIANLIHKAIKQNPKDMPFIIFIDINLPFENLENYEEKLIHKEVKRVFETLNKSAYGSTSFNFIIVTSIPFHFFDPNSTTPPPECEYIQSSEPKYSLPQEVLEDIKNSILKYGDIPQEI